MPEEGDDQRVIAQLRAELEYYRDKAIKLDERVFQMRALLQSGKGFSEILNLDALMQAFMAVCRERYGVRRLRQLDEYPPAMFREGGAGSSVRPVSPADNMGAGASIGNQCRGLACGSQVRIVVD